LHAADELRCAGDDSMACCGFEQVKVAASGILTDEQGLSDVYLCRLSDDAAPRTACSINGVWFPELWDVRLTSLCETWTCRDGVWHRQPYGCGLMLWSAEKRPSRPLQIVFAKGRSKVPAGSEALLAELKTEALVGGAQGSTRLARGSSCGSGCCR
jgi:hypothetical protein